MGSRWSHSLPPSTVKLSRMSMFSGLGNQISGFVAQKMGTPAPAEGEPAEGAVPVEGAQVENGEGGEVPPPEGAMGGAMGFAQGLMMKAAAVKEGVAAKAGGLGAGNLQAPFGGGGAQEGEVMEGGEQMGEGGVPVEGAEGEAQPGAMGFVAGLMMKAHSLKEGVPLSRPLSPTLCPMSPIVTPGSGSSVAGSLIGTTKLCNTWPPQSQAYEEQIFPSQDCR